MSIDDAINTEITGTEIFPIASYFAKKKMTAKELLILIQNYAAMCRVYGTGTEVAGCWLEVVEAVKEALPDAR